MDSKYYDGLAEGYDAFVQKKDKDGHYPFAGYGLIVDTLAKTANAFDKNAMVLDLGCGTGVLDDLLARAGHPVIGLDFSQEMIAKAKANCPAGIFYQHDLSSMTLPDMIQGLKFKVVIMNFFFHLIPDDKKVAFLRFINDELLLPDGMALIGDTAFKTFAELLDCKESQGASWENKAYPVFSQLKAEFPPLVFQKVSFCTGILAFHQTRLEEAKPEPVSPVEATPAQPALAEPVQTAPASVEENAKPQEEPAVELVPKPSDFDASYWYGLSEKAIAKETPADKLPIHYYALAETEAVNAVKPSVVSPSKAKAISSPVPSEMPSTYWMVQGFKETALAHGDHPSYLYEAHKPIVHYQQGHTGAKAQVAAPLSLKAEEARGTSVPSKADQAILEAIEPSHLTPIDEAKSDATNENKGLAKGPSIPVAGAPEYVTRPASRTPDYWLSQAYETETSLSASDKHPVHWYAVAEIEWVKAHEAEWRHNPDRETRPVDVKAVDDVPESQVTHWARVRDVPGDTIAEFGTNFYRAMAPVERYAIKHWAALYEKLHNQYLGTFTANDLLNYRNMAIQSFVRYNPVLPQTKKNLDYVCRLYAASFIHNRFPGDKLDINLYGLYYGLFFDLRAVFVKLIQAYGSDCTPIRRDYSNLKGSKTAECLTYGLATRKKK